MIGVFDSGLGGLSIWRAIAQLLPRESMLYVADQARCPYGPRPAEEIISFSAQITRYLLSQDCKLVVLACNTATAAAIDTLRQQFDVPFVGLEPAIKPAVAASRSHKVGILATRGTFSGGHFQRAQARFGKDAELLLQVGHGLVEAVEQGHLESPETESLLRSYLEPMLQQQADQIVLGCTHYPFLRPLMERIVAGQAHILDPAPAVARQVASVLRQHHLSDRRSAPQYHFETTADPATFVRQLQRLLGEALPESLKVKQIYLAD